MAEKVIDPVCRMEIDKDTAEESLEHRGETFYFCCVGCKEKFENDPMKYMNKESAGDHKSHCF